MSETEKIHINASRSYDVHIGTDILKNTGHYLKQIKNGGKAALITDSKLGEYAAVVKTSLVQSGYDVYQYVIKAEEKSKSIYELENMLHFLLSSGFTRKDTVISLGGGICSDISGLAASIYMRGIDSVIIPTTSLSATDACIGGKTGINLGGKKNVIGSFHQPLFVLTDVNCFKTLSDKQFSQGLAEAVKCGVLYDENLIEALETGIDKSNCIPLIKRCIEIKKHYIEADELDGGIRKMLNLGHTAAHAIEALSAGKVSHAEAVSIGMAITGEAAYALGCCDEQCVDRIKKVLVKYSLPVETEYTAYELANAALSDKKCSGNFIDITLPCRIGHCKTVQIEKDKLSEFFGLAGSGK